MEFASGPQKPPPDVFFTILLILTPEGLSSPSNIIPTPRRTIRCSQGGVRTALFRKVPYEVCGEQYCVLFDKLNERENYTNTESVSAVETVCPTAPYCQHVDCTFCSANVLNPECWPLRALLATITILYFVITGCYVFLYVPLVVGRPVRIITNIGWELRKVAIRNIKTFYGDRVKRTARRRNLAEVIAILCLLLHVSNGCQMVDVLQLFNSLPNIHFKTVSDTAIRDLQDQRKWDTFSGTFASLAPPPKPLLATIFITDSRETTISRQDARPALQCSDFANARDRQCSVILQNKKRFAGAGILPIGTWFNTPESLTIVYPSLTFLQQDVAVIARVTNMVMSEFVNVLSSRLCLHISVPPPTFTAQKRRMSLEEQCVLQDLLPVKIRWTKLFVGQDLLGKSYRDDRRGLSRDQDKTK
ncbi:hypothetical protein OSTOST_11174 [Ostertagia ostertagi]